MSKIIQVIEKLAEEYSGKLKQKINSRVGEMETDNNSHYLIYRVLGIPKKEGSLIDVYQNKGKK